MAQASTAAPEAAERPVGDAAVEEDPLAVAIAARGAVHSNGLIGGIGLKAASFEVLSEALGRPGGREHLVAVALEAAGEALDRARISYGVLDLELRAAVEEFADAVAAGEDRLITRKVAEGEAAQAGAAPQVEYALNYRGRPFRELASLEPSSTRTNCTVVHAEDVLATLRPPVPAKNGTNVQGETLKAAALKASGEPAGLESVAGEHTVVSGAELLAECDGMCVEDVAGKLRVVPEIVVPRIDEATGRVPESGVSRANVIVRGAVAGPGVATTETVFVGVGRAGGGIEGRAPVQARNLIVNGRVVGERQGRAGPIEIGEICAVGEVVNRAIAARRLLVLGDCHLGSLDAEEGAWIEGDMRGGRIDCRNVLHVRGDLGTESGGSQTHVALPAEAMGEQRKRRMARDMKEQREQLQDLLTRLDELEKRSEKRTKADPYWARLAQGERAQPQGPMQLKSLRQFAAFVEEKRGLTRLAKGVKQSLARLAAEKKQAESEAAQSEATVMVGGTIYLDASFEIARQLSSEDDELPVTFVHEGQEHLRTTLGKARAVLVKQVRAYCEQQSAWVDEKRAALDKMFEGQEHKPTGPEIQDKGFELPIHWLDVETPEDVEITSVLTVRAAEPQTIVVRNRARLRQPRQGVTVVLRAAGARGEYQVTPNAGPPPSCLEDETVRQELEGLAAGGVTALDVLRGVAKLE